MELDKMIHDVKEYYNIRKDFRNVDYFETENSKQIYLDLKSAIKSGHLIAFTGIVGSGKTTTIRRIRQELSRENEIIVCTNMAVDKNNVSLTTLIQAIFYDLGTEKNFKIPTQHEYRERVLKELIKKKNKPVALFIDEAHDLHHKTLVGLKRLIELVQEGGSTLSIVLVGHPRLKVELERPALEEIGGRTTFLELTGIKGYEKEFLEWLINKSSDENASLSDLFEEDVISYFSERLVTPMQVNNFVWKSLVEGYQIGEKPVSIETVRNVISKDLDGIEAKLVRFGYNVKSLSDITDIKQNEIKAYLNGKLATERTQEIHREMLRMGITG